MDEIYVEIYKNFPWKIYFLFETDKSSGWSLGGDEVSFLSNSCGIGIGTTTGVGIGTKQIFFKILVQTLSFSHLHSHFFGEIVSNWFYKFYAKSSKKLAIIYIGKLYFLNRPRKFVLYSY